MTCSSCGAKLGKHTAICSCGGQPEEVRFRTPDQTIARPKKVFYITDEDGNVMIDHLCTRRGYVK